MTPPTTQICLEDWKICCPAAETYCKRRLSSCRPSSELLLMKRVASPRSQIKVISLLFNMLSMSVIALQGQTISKSQTSLFQLRITLKGDFSFIANMDWLRPSWATTITTQFLPQPILLPSLLSHRWWSQSALSNKTHAGLSQFRVCFPKMSTSQLQHNLQHTINSRIGTVPFVYYPRT